MGPPFGAGFPVKNILTVLLNDLHGSRMDLADLFGGVGFSELTLRFQVDLYFIYRKHRAVNP